MNGAKQHGGKLVKHTTHNELFWEELAEVLSSQPPLIFI
jgi:hypothetical protein